MVVTTKTAIIARYWVVSQLSRWLSPVCQEDCNIFLFEDKVFCIVAHVSVAKSNNARVWLNTSSCTPFMVT